MNPQDSEAHPGARETKPRWRGIVVFLGKALVTITLITWLIRSGSLELNKLKIFVESPRVLFVSLGAWVLMSVLLATYRWRLLLGGVGREVPALRGAALQTTALFFNGLVPGNVGGDFIKNQAVLGNQAAKIFVLVAVERTVGLVTLIWAGAVGVALSTEQIQRHPELYPVVGAISILTLGSIVGPWIVVLLVRATPSEPGAPIEGGGLLGALRRALGAAVTALQLLGGAKRSVSKALLVSFLMHLGNVAFFLFLTRELGNPGAGFSEVAMIFPLGMLTLVLPISISGLGVGHVMFNELFSVIGLVSGASIFNVYIVALLAPCLLGAIPYLFMRGREEATPSSDEA